MLPVLTKRLIPAGGQASAPLLLKRRKQMAIKGKTSVPVIVLLAFLCHIPLSLAKQQPLFTVQVNKETIDIEAKEAILGDVVRAVSEKVGIALKMGEPLTETVTISLKAIPYEEAFKSLLAGHSHTLIFKKTMDDQFVLVELQVLGNGLAHKVDIDSAAPSPNQDGLSSPNTVGKKLSREQLKQQFGNMSALMKEMTAVPVNDGDMIQGIKVTNLRAQSAISQLGISTGDIISSVNGNRIESAEQFLKAVQSPPEDMSIVMITRTLNARNGLSDSLYLQLR